MSSRDPRKDPRPGDVTKDGNDIILVVRRMSGIIYWASSHQRSDELLQTPIDTWPRMCKNDEVIHVADC